MKKKGILVVALTLLCALLCTTTAAFADEGTTPAASNPYKTVLNCRAGGGTIYASRELTGAYSYEFEFDAKGSDPNAAVFGVELGADNGSHYVHIDVFGRSVNAYVFPVGGAADSGKAVPAENFTGTRDFITAEVPSGDPNWWMLNGAARFRFKFEVASDYSSISMWSAISGNEYVDARKIVIALPEDGFMTDYVRNGVTDGKVRLAPSFYEKFTVYGIAANGSELDLSGEDVTLDNPAKFSKSYILPDVDTDCAQASRYILPAPISTAGFEGDEVVFTASFEYSRPETAIWNSSFTFGAVFGMENASDTYTTSGAGSFMNSRSAASTNGNSALFEIGTGNGSAVESKGEIGSGRVIHSNFMVPLVQVSLTAKANGKLAVSIVESPAHPSLEQKFTQEYEGFDFNGYAGIIIDAGTAYKPDETTSDQIQIHNTVFTVNEVVMPTGVALDKTSVTLRTGENATLTATVSPADVTDASVVWESNHPEIASVDDNGKITAEGFGEAVITVKSKKDPSKSATCTVNVIERVSSVSLDKTTISLKRGASAELTATVSPAGKCDERVRWVSDNDETVTVDGGRITAIKAGTTIVRAISLDDETKTAECSVTVTNPVTALELNKETLSLNAGGSEKLEVTVYPASAENKLVRWTTSNAEVATIDDEGNVTAVASGTATITVISLDDENVTATCVVTVKKAVSSVSLDVTEVELTVGEEKTLTATVLPADADDKTLVWTSSDESVVTVSGGKIVAVKEGEATITVSVGGKTATCTVTVKAAPAPESTGCGKAAADAAKLFGAVALLGAAVLITKK